MSQSAPALPSREQILERLREVPAIPVASVRVVKLLQDPDYGTEELVRNIEYDPGLTSAVLRLANSALLGGARNIASIREAVLRLGSKRISQLVLSSAVGPHMRSGGRGYDAPAEVLWKHAVATAIGAETLAARVDMLAPPFTFTAGLLHNVGKTVLGNHLGVDADPILALARDAKISFEESERRRLGLDHAELGGLLLEQWGLPQEIVEVVRQHHAPGPLGADNPAVDLVHLADLFAVMGGIGGSPDGTQSRASRETLARIPINRAVAELVIKDTATEMESLRALFEGGSS